MVTRGSVTSVLPDLALTRDGEYVFRPDTLSRLSVRASHTDATLVVSTELMFTLDEDGSYDVARVAVQYWPGSSRIDVLVMHQPGLLASPRGCNAVMQAIQAVMHERSGDFTTVAVLDPYYRGAISRFTSGDGGDSWDYYDVTDRLTDFLLQDGLATIKSGGWATTMTVEALFDRLDTVDEVVDQTNGMKVQTHGILVHFESQTQCDEGPRLAIYDDKERAVIYYDMVGDLWLEASAPDGMPVRTVSGRPQVVIHLAKTDDGYRAATTSL